MKINRILCGYIMAILLFSLLIGVVSDAKNLKLVPNNGNYDIRLTDENNEFFDGLKNFINNIINSKVEISDEVETILSDLKDKILNKTSFKRGLVISAVDEIEEGHNFSVLVTDYSGNPIKGAKVSLISVLSISDVYETNESGIAEIVAPNITSTQETMVIVAEKIFYIPGFKTIKILDVDKTLVIVVRDKVEAGERFDVVVKTADGETIENAIVKFDGKNLSTDENGKVTFTAPLITNDKFCEITAEKKGYKSAKADITILGKETSFLSLVVGNWILISVIIAIGAIAAFAAWWYKQV